PCPPTATSKHPGAREHRVAPKFRPCGAATVVASAESSPAPGDGPTACRMPREIRVHTPHAPRSSSGEAGSVGGPMATKNARRSPVIATNRQARRDFEILDEIEAGI